MNVRTLSLGMLLWAAILGLTSQDMVAQQFPTLPVIPKEPAADTAGVQPFLTAFVAAMNAHNADAFPAPTTGHDQRTDALATADASVAKPIFVPPDGNRSAEPTGDIRIKVSGADTGGAVAVLEVRTGPDFGTPLHVHHVENEWFYAIEGEYEVKVGDDIFHLKPGGSVYAPKLIPHAFSDVSEKGGKMMVVAQPAGHIEAFSVDLFKVISSGTHDEAAIKAVFLKHHMDIVGPPLPKKHQPMTMP